MNANADFDVFACPLDGISLIEASAGTGKTWALCGLYLRLLLERELPVQGILVVTFTNAATAELRERIRSRIVETLAHLRGDDADAGGDEFVPRLVDSLRSRHGLTDATLTGRLDLALQTFDEAAIFTIHGFCQRALADAAFAARMPLATELVRDDTEFIAEAANDFWRRRIAGDDVDPGLAALLAERGDSPARFARLLARQLARPLAAALWPAGLDASSKGDCAALAAAHGAARTIWGAERAAVVQIVHGALSRLNGQTYKAASVQAAASGWDALLAGDDALAAIVDPPAKVELLASTTLQAKTKKNCTAPGHPFFDVAQRLLDERAACLQTLELARLRLLRELLAEGGAAQRSAKRSRRVVAFDDLLVNLHERLAGGEAQWLAGALKARFPAALIDEFQDTDPLQFAIFEAVYGAADAPLFLVGDPKQAIYSFRNADLHTYLQAQARATARYTLGANQRATGTLIDALNVLFGANEQAFMLPGLRYPRVAPGSRPRQSLVDRTQACAPLQVWALPADPASGEPLLLKADALRAAAAATAGEIARLVTGAQQREITLAAAPLRAGDIAVLVRSHAQGSLMRGALAALGVGSVELSQASVYRSPEAEALERVLAAILEPARERLLKAALATELLGLDAAAIEALAADEAQMLRWTQRFADWRDAWLARGIGFMLRELMHDDAVAARLLQRDDGERRMTNLLHLAECLHQAAQTHPAPDALLRWFHARRIDERSDDATQLRLESDRNLVQIVTIHKAKGLEYPIVFCPFLWNARRAGSATGLDGVAYHDDAGRAVIDFRKGFADESAAADAGRRIQLESAAEELRLAYVALTRAMHRCVIVAGGYLTRTGKATSAKEGGGSLLNWLVAGVGQSPRQWFDGTRSAASIAAAWQALAARHAPALAIAPLPQRPARPVPQDRPSPETIAALPAPLRILPGWWIGSYSALVHGATHELAAVDHDLRAAEGPAAHAASAAAPPGAEAALDDDDILRFPRGAAAGECLHAVFERADFGDSSRWPEVVAEALRLHRAALPGAPLGAGAATDASRARMLQRMLRDVLHTPLPVGTAQPLRLHAVPRGCRLAELEFHLPSHALEAGALEATLAALGYGVPGLAFSTLRGYLKGFIDCVFEHAGRYFVADWKSNRLGETAAAYAHAPLADAMAAQGYHLQALLYCVALHRLLRRRLPGYDATSHFGGALVLFVRGVRPGWTNGDGTPAGLHFHRPAPEVIRRLSALFDPPETAR